MYIRNITIHIFFNLKYFDKRINTYKLYYYYGYTLIKIFVIKRSKLYVKLRINYI